MFESGQSECLSMGSLLSVGCLGLVSSELEQARRVLHYCSCSLRSLCESGVALVFVTFLSGLGPSFSCDCSVAVFVCFLVRLAILLLLSVLNLLPAAWLVR